MTEQQTPPDYAWHVGIDWGGQSHQVCVVRSSGDVHDEFAVPHSGEGLAELIRHLGELGANVAVAIEVPRGAIVEGLVERGFAVYAINPKQLDRFRDRHTAGGAKDDRRDAQVLARSLRTDLSSFRRVRLDHPLVIQIRELSRMSDAIEEDFRRAANRLRDVLHRTFPAAIELCPAADEPWLWALLDKAPTAQGAATLKTRAVENILRRHRIRRLVPDQVVRALHAKPLPTAPGVSEAASRHIKSLLPQLELLHEQRRDIERQMATLLEQLGNQEPEPGQTSEHRDVQILLSFVGVGTNVGATMLAEAGQALAERDYQALRAHTGNAPITRQSGKRRVVVMRRACSLRLREATYHWGRVAAIYDPQSRARYQALRARGHSHGRAVRGVIDWLLRVLVACLKAGTLYRPAITQGAAA